MKKILSIAVAAFSICFASPVEIEGPKVGEEAPYFMIKTIMYNEFKLIEKIKEIKEKDGLLVIDFFATWCEPCKREFPIFESIHKELAEKNVEFYAIAIDSKRIDVWNYIKKVSEVSFEVLWDPNAWSAARHYGADKVLPQLFIIDGDRIIQARHVGEIKNLEAVLKAEIERLKPGSFPEFKDVKAEMGETAVKKEEPKE